MLASVLRRVSRNVSRFRNRLCYSTNSAADHVARKLMTDPLYFNEVTTGLSRAANNNFVQALNPYCAKVDCCVPSVQSKSSGSTQGEFPEKQALESSLARCMMLFRYMLPFVGFGFTSNAALILAGDFIDTTFGTMFGFSTLAAAGLGNAVSDTVGLLSTEPMHWLSCRLGVNPAERITNTDPSHDDSSDAAMKVVAQVLGMIVGCLLGLLSLFLVEERSPRMVDLIEVCLTADQKMSLSKNLVKCDYNKGETIIEYGSEGEWLHIIVDGTVEVIGRDPSGEKVFVCNIEEGGVVGELELIMNRPCIADVIAVTDVETRKIHKEDLQKFLSPMNELLKRRIMTDDQYKDNPYRQELLQLGHQAN